VQKFGKLNKLESKQLIDGGIQCIDSPVEPEPESSNSGEAPEEKESSIKLLSPKQRTSKILAVSRGKSVRVGDDK
jgi:hypothetical protein